MRNLAPWWPGPGMAGLTAAKGLHDQGWQVHLAERRPAFAAVPTGLFFPANGMRALTALGAGTTLLSCGQPIAAKLRMGQLAATTSRQQTGVPGGPRSQSRRRRP